MLGWMDWLKIIGTVFGISGVLATGATKAGLYWLETEYIPRSEKGAHDTEYVTIASQNREILWKMEDELKVLNAIPTSQLTPEQIARKATLIERIRQIKAL